MSSRSLVRWPVAALFPLCAAAAQAQAAPPLKPGLWQVATERTMDGQKAPDLGEHMKKMSPEMRKRMQANMKQHGVDMSGGAGDMKLCMTRESLDEGRWRSEGGGCDTTFSSRTATLWKWRSVCKQPPSESEGEAHITSPERYTVKVSTTSTAQGRKHNSQVTMNAKWIGVDCGDLKPMAPPAKPAKR